MFLDIPKTTHAPDFLPPEEGLSDFQINQRDIMLEQFRDSRLESYDWAPGKDLDHHGSVWPYVFRGKTILIEPDENDGNYCCGFSVENLFWSLRDYYGEVLWTSEAGPSTKELRDTRSKFFVIRKEYYRGGAEGVVYLIRALKKRWDGLHKTKPNEYPSWEDEVYLDVEYHTDPYKAKFGAYVQLQPNEDAMSAGHSGIFVGLEKRHWRGNRWNEPGEYECIRLMHSNRRNDYGFKDGVGFGWYAIGKKNSRGFSRVVHIGQVI
jgi:hypothetical protein